MIEHCKVCTRASLHPLFRDASGGQWHRCLSCGSDSSETTYEDVRGIYDEDYLRNHTGHGEGRLLAEVRSNCDWFQAHAGKVKSRRFLDVGCGDGAAMAGMRERGWAPHGFDVVPGAGHLCPGADVRAAPGFGRHLFEGRFGALLCREAIEHVEGWRQLLHECFHALEPGGLFQVQTPAPAAEPHPGPYQRAHLQIFSPVAMELALRTHGFVALDQWHWKNGMAFLCQRP